MVKKKTPDELMAEFAAHEKALKDGLATLGLPDLGALGDGAEFDPYDGFPPLLRLAGESADEDLIAALSEVLESGADPNETSRYGETLAFLLWNRGRIDALALARKHGAQIDGFGFSPLHEAVAFGDLTDVLAAAQDKAMLSERDTAGRSPFLLACRLGLQDKAAALLQDTPKDVQRAPNGQGPLHFAAYGQSIEMIGWLIDQGFDPCARDEFGGTPLLSAVESDAADIVALLLSAGADPLAGKNCSAEQRSRSEGTVQTVFAKAAALMMKSAQSMPGMDAPSDIIMTPANSTRSSQVAVLLLAAGADYADFDAELKPEITGATLIPPTELSPEDFARGHEPRFGKTNPEPALEPFWREQIRTGDSGFGGGRMRFQEGNAQHEPPPVWSFQRFGQSATCLPGGRWVLIAGEHEDHYDPDFYIYNDVTVLDGKGGVAHYLYQREVFPPTDFHTATLLGDMILLIGNLGYQGERLEGETQVMALDLKDYSMARIATSGDNPGWICRHRAVLEDGRIVVSGGKVEPGYRDQDGRWALDLETWCWARLED